MASGKLEVNLTIRRLIIRLMTKCGTAMPTNRPNTTASVQGAPRSMQSAATTTTMPRQIRAYLPSEMLRPVISSRLRSSAGLGIERRRIAFELAVVLAEHLADLRLRDRARHFAVPFLDAFDAPLERLAGARPAERKDEQAKRENAADQE